MMKLSLGITLSVIAAASLFGWRNQIELADLTRTYQEVGRQARALGIQEGPSRTSLQRTRSSQFRQSDPKALARDLAAFAKELETIPEASDARVSDDEEQRTLDWQRRLLALDPETMKKLVAEISTTNDLTDESREGLLFMVLETLAESHPQSALEVIADSPDLLKNPYARYDAASLALTNGMKSDPAASTAWFKDHRDLFPGEIERVITERVLRSTSLTNPKLAFRLIDDLEIQDAKYAIRMISNPARTPAQRDATLAAFREYIATIQDPKQREDLAGEGASTMITTAFLDGVDSGIQAISNGRFTTEEIETYAWRTISNFNRGDTEKWIDWLAKELPTDKIITQAIPQIFSNWIQSDYHAAGEWLASTPAGPVKTATGGVYANALAEKDPATAAKWAHILPPGEDRDQLLPRIYQSWLKTDPAAAASFADQNGIPK